MRARYVAAAAPAGEIYRSAKEDVRVGAWGEGNFQDDETLDWLGEAVFDPLLRFVEEKVGSTFIGAGALQLARQGVRIVDSVHQPGAMDVAVPIGPSPR